VRYFFLILFGVIVFGGIWAANELSEVRFDGEQVIPTAVFNNTVLELEIVQTQEEQQQGLSGRVALPENVGMLFVYEQATIPIFWMKDMNFSLDIVWIGEDKKIVHITENVAPETYPQTFSPQAPVQYVLEVNANWTNRYSVSVGDKVVLHGVF